MTIETRVKFQDIVENQLPRFVREDFPLLPDFLKSYYVSQEIPGGPYDLIQNLDRYVKLDELYDIKDSTILNGDLSMDATQIEAGQDGNFTVGFPDNYGLIKIDDEIISYEYKTDSTFEGCTRGFSGITSYIGSNTPDKLVFSSSVGVAHTSGTRIENLNVIFLQEFFKKIKTQFAPGFTERPFSENIDQRNFLFNSESFYTSKGTDNAFEILFKALYAAKVEVVHPDTYLFRPSNADYKITKDFIVEEISGDPLKLKNLTFNQKSTGARGTVTDVVPILYGPKEGERPYFAVSIDSGYSRDISVQGTIKSEFVVNPKTKLTNDVSIGSTVLDVDSTLGFPWTGKLIIKDPDDNPVSLAYTGKSVNQFFDITGINNTFKSTTDVREDDYSFSYVGINTDEQIQVRIAACLQDIEFKEPNYSYEPGDVIRLQSIGVETKVEKAYNFTYNIKTNWEIKEIRIIDEEQNKYTFITWDTQYLKPGHKLIIKSDDTIPVVITGTVGQITSDRSFEVIVSSTMNLVRQWSFENQILKGNSSKYPYIDDFIANTLNSYIIPASGDVLVTSNSLPSYDNKETNPYDRKVTYTGRLVSQEQIPLTTTTDHGFYTGDAIFYKAGITDVVSTTPDGLTFTTPIESRFNNVEDGVYYVRRIDQFKISMSRSKGDLYNDIYVEFTGDVTDNQFIYFEFKDKIWNAQKLVRKLLPSDTKSGNWPTDPGYTGILNNGVEILNYKSNNSTIYYGDVRSFEVKRGGYNYDVVAPPLLVINDTVGTGATGIVATEGELVRVDVVDTGYDYVDDPVVTFSGGNPKEVAEAEVQTIAVVHELPFNAGEESAGSKGVGLSTNTNTENTIGFTTFHKFRDAEEVIYDSRNLPNVIGLSTDSPYYVRVVDNFRVRFHNNEGDALAGINTVDLTGYGSGRQFIRAAQLKRIVSSVIVSKPGKGYQNKKRTIRTASTGISTAKDSFVIENHGYLDKEIIKYSAPLTGDSVTGLSENDEYYVRKISDNEFSLNLVGVGSTAVDYYWNNYIPVDIIKSGGGTFNYKPITATVQGTIGVSTRAGGQDFSAVLQPIVRGEIKSVDMTLAGVGYGASEIINFNRQPEITFENGELAQCKPIINNGKIVSILIQNAGRNYHAPPDVEIRSSQGDYAQLTPRVDGGVISEIKVIKGGAGYVDGETEILLKAPGLTAQVEANIRSWQVNLFERNLQNLQSDDGVLEENISHQSLEYGHIYAPRPLRESTYAISGEEEDNTLYGTPDLVKDPLSGDEIASVNHSPILGWAYDGHPIYGPYAFTNTDGSGSIVEMTSGYELKPDLTNRPPVGVYPAGFFVEDYVYTGNGYLDEHNGRFAITPDYPKGIYAYHATINLQNDSTGIFEGYRRPAFPYFVGTSFKSKPEVFNFLITSNQEEYEIEKHSWIRNTRDYHTNSVKSGYDYIFNSNEIKEQTLEITEVSLGEINEIGITTGGSGYKVGDSVVFDNTGTNGRNADAEVKIVGGKTIDTVSLATTSFSNVELIPNRSSNSFIGVMTQPHSLLNKDIVRITGLSTNIAGLEGSYSVGVRSEGALLAKTIAATSGVEWLNVSGLNGLGLSPNDILIIDQEKVKVLEIKIDSGQLKVRRAQEGTSAGIHTSASILWEDPRRFSFNTRAGIQTGKSFRVNQEYYFNPPDVVGTGTARGVGIGTTITFSNPGTGFTQAFLPSQELWFEEHGFQLNDEVVYKANGGTPIQSYSGVTGHAYANLDTWTNLYAVPLSANTIGIATGKVGLGSDTDGYYVGINSTLVPSTLYFTNTGVGDTHSLRTRLKDVISSNVSQNVVTVSTASTHQLLLDDTVWVSVKPIGTTTVTVKYNDYNRRIVFDPQDFVAGNVDLSLNTITVTEGVFSRGDKVIHTASTPCGGLTNEKMYYVIFYTDTQIRLVEDRAQLESPNPTYVILTSASAGTLSKVNPPILARKNQQWKFDLSDSSLSFQGNGTTYSAFSMGLYRDALYKDEFITTKEGDVFEVVKTGKPGIDANANLLLSITDDIPKALFYKFTPDNIDKIPNVKNEIIIDALVPNYNRIDIQPTYYDGNWSITGIGTTTFSYNIPNTPDVTSYTKTNADASYVTNSKTAEGRIVEFDIRSGGAMYKTAPKITNVSAGTTVRAGVGSGAVLTTQTSNIGAITKTKLNDIGFDYPSDPTLKVIPNLPDIVEVERLNKLGRVGVLSQGRNYVVSPDLVVMDGYTKEVLLDVDLEYQLGDDTVKIVRNVEGIYDVPPRIIPVGNSNGVGIRDLLYSPDGAGTDTLKPHTVRLYIDDVFNEASDFEAGEWYPGEKFLLENVNVGLGSTGLGYNSKEYNYELWEITAASGQIGGANAYIEFAFPEGFIGAGQTPGKMIPSQSAGRLILQNHFPIYDVELVQSQFFVGEKVEDEVGAVGFVQRWVPESNTLTISAQQEFDVDSKIKGLSSLVQAYIRKNISFAAEINTGAGTTVFHGFQSDSGFLNNSFQRLPDNGYYQRFAYALRSQVPIDKWGEDVKALSHVSGFARFSDLEIESKDPNAVITRTEPANFELIAEMESIHSIFDYPDFDDVSEVTIDVNGEIISKDVLFANRPITDYYQSIGNRALNITDFSDTFNNQERSTKYSTIGEFSDHDVFNKVFTLVKDQTYSDERQFSVVSLLQHSDIAYINEYATLDTYLELGTFDYVPTKQGWDLTYVPIKNEWNLYDVSNVSISVKDNIVGVASTALGDTVSLGTTHVDIPYDSDAGIGATTTLVAMATTYRAAKLMVQLENTNQEFFGTELNIVHDGTKVGVTQYGDIRNSLSEGSIGFGTFHAYISGSNVLVDFIPNVGLALTADASTIFFGKASEASGIGSITMDVGRLISYSRDTAASTASIIASYQSDDTVDDWKATCGYYIVSFEGTGAGDGMYEMFEVAIINSSTNECEVSWGNVGLNTVGLGTVGISSVGSARNLTFESHFPGTARVLGIEMQVYEDIPLAPSLDLSNVEWYNDVGRYVGTKLDLKTAFNLTHNVGGDELDIFRRQFNGNDNAGSGGAGINIENNTVEIVDHFFVTGERVTYSYTGATSLNAVGIKDATVGGATTDKLPKDLYVVKTSSSTLRFAETAEKALRKVPEVFELDAVGIGTSHHITATNQASKSLVTIDNMIQSPLAGTAVTTALGAPVVFDQKLPCVGVTSFAAGDMIQLENEICKVLSIGIGSANNITVLRAQVGTTLDSHAGGVTVTKLAGNYNIEYNTLHFVEAPAGNTPLSTTTDPDENDWTGITTHSTFHGRIFTRTAPVQSQNETYATNAVFNDISDQFTGIQSYFSLTTGIGASETNALGFSTYNGVVLINDMFQEPTGAEQGNYDFKETAGLTTVTFTGEPLDVAIDRRPTDTILGENANRTWYPNGGKIISVGSTGGFAYQPLISAGGTAIVSSAGTITSISIGNSGSGYRAGIQTTVNVGVQTYSAGIATYVAIGTAAISGGHIVSIAVTNPGVGYTYYPDVSTTFMNAVAAASTTIISVADTTGIVPGNLISIAHTTTGSPSTVVGVMTNVTVTAVNSGTISIGASDVISAAVGIGTTTAAPVVTIKRNDPPDVIIDAPLSYTNIPLTYHPSSTTGVGQSASVDIVVGQGSSVVQFKVGREGFGYGNGEILTVAVGGATGIPTTADTHKDFKLTIEDIATDEFSSWHFGQLQPLDNFSSEFDGFRKVFLMKVNTEAVALKAAPGWDVDPIQSLLVFVNGLLQEPNYAYSLANGGSALVFSDAPKADDYVHVLFYKGTPGIDVTLLKVAKYIKKGDQIDIQNNPEKMYNGFPQGIGLNQEPRVIIGITSLSSDAVSTNPYNGLGITTDTSLLRPASWKKQTEDLVINQRKVGKDRPELEADVYPASYLIQNVAGITTYLYVDSVRPFFNPYDEQTASLDTLQNFVDIKSQDPGVQGIATATVSDTGTISAITISNVGSGYTGAPTVQITPPPEGSSYTQATATATIVGDKINTVTVSNAGTGYTNTNPPAVHISAPNSVVSYKVDVDEYAGDFGSIVGFGTTTTGGNNQVIFDFYIPDGSPLRDYASNGSGQVSAATTVSGITTGDFFVAYDTNHIISGPDAVNIPTRVELTAGGTGYKTEAGETTGTRTVGTTGGGGGQSLTLDITIASGVITAIEINNQGTGYVLNSVGGIDGANGSGCTFNITEVIGTLETRKTDGQTKVGATTSYMDCVYQVASAETVTVTNASIGATSLNGPYTGLTTDVRRVFCNIAGIATDNFDSTLLTFDSNKTGVGTVTWDTQNTSSYSGSIIHMPNQGKYSWGKITVARADSKTYNYYGDNGVIGLQTSGMVIRYNPLEASDYVIS